MNGRIPELVYIAILVGALVLLTVGIASGD